MEDFATPLSHLAEIVQEVQQLCKKERECVCIHKSHFFRELSLSSKRPYLIEKFSLSEPNCFG